MKIFINNQNAVSLIKEQLEIQKMKELRKVLLKL